MCIFCGGQCGGSVEYLFNLMAIIGVPYFVMIISRMRTIKKINKLENLFSLSKIILKVSLHQSKIKLNRDGFESVSVGMQIL